MPRPSCKPTEKETAPRPALILLSSAGLVYHRCEPVRVDGDEVGIVFLEQGKRNVQIRGPAAVE
jgi:hypothetical protein